MQVQNRGEINADCLPLPAYHRTVVTKGAGAFCENCTLTCIVHLNMHAGVMRTQGHPACQPSPILYSCTNTITCALLTMRRTDEDPGALGPGSHTPLISLGAAKRSTYRLFASPQPPGETRGPFLYADTSYLSQKSGLFLSVYVSVHRQGEAFHHP